MPYHITQVTNNSGNTLVITNPAYVGDSKLVLPGHTYNPSRPILVNTGTGNMTWAQAVLFANNFYTSADDFCIWDNGNNAIIGIGEKNQGNNDSVYFQASAGNVQVTVNAKGQLALTPAVAAASAR